MSSGKYKIFASVLVKGASCFIFSTVFCWSFLRLFPYFLFPSKLPRCQFQSSFLCLKLKGRHHFLPAEKANIPTIQVHLDGGKLSHRISWKHTQTCTTAQRDLFYCFYCCRIHCFLFILNKNDVENEEHT